MDGARVLDHLVQAEVSVARAEQQVARQREILAALERAGCDVAVAKQLLARFEEALKLQTETLNRCRQEWKEISEVTLTPQTEGV
jgi:hypothetical protein